MPVYFVSKKQWGIRLITVKSEMIKNCCPTVLSPMFIPNAKLGDHNICFYTSPQEKQSLLFSNLKVGLDNGCSAVYVASEEDAKHVRFEMKKFGLEVDDPKN